MMLAPMKAVTLHMGRMHVTIAMMKPITPRAMPTISMPIDMLALGVMTELNGNGESTDLPTDRSDYRGGPSPRSFWRPLKVRAAPVKRA